MRQFLKEVWEKLFASSVPRVSGYINPTWSLEAGRRIYQYNDGTRTYLWGLQASNDRNPWVPIIREQITPCGSP